MKERKSRDKLTVVVGVLIIILTAMALMLGATMYYRQGINQETEETTTKPTVKIPDITNAPTEPSTPAATTPAATTPAATTPAATTPATTTPAATTPATTTPAETTPAATTPAETTSAVESGEQSSSNRTGYLAEVEAATLQKSGSHRVDITSMTQITAQEVRTLIEAYTVPDMPYLDGSERTAGDFDYTLKRRNLSAIADPVALQYGVLVGNTAVRAFPTWQKMSNGTGYDSFDYLQESLLMAGEGVAVLHQTEDKIWSFVQADSYNGWVQTEMIAFCTLDEMKSFVTADSFAVVTEPVLTAEGVALRMGTRLPLVKVVDGAAVLQMAKKDDSGKLKVIETAVDAGMISEGYLALSEDAIVEQAKKLLGTNYGWGDSNAYMDCSSTLRAVYNCFGIVLPRNTSWMPNCGLKVTDVREMGTQEKRDLIASLPKGSILLINGHAMMYVGQIDGVESMLHNVTQYKPSAGAEIERPLKCVITPIDICNTADANYVDLYRYVIEVDWSKISQ
ncbi:MAG: SH3 domain-containing protein [Lachnospiraceae bacterium]|nr:SH3 domain-containing protein [Lachnospiraceae bacterium]